MATGEVFRIEEEEPFRIGAGPDREVAINLDEVQTAHPEPTDGARVTIQRNTETT